MPMFETKPDITPRTDSAPHPSWGTCNKCGGPADMHYVLWCPQCNKPARNKTQYPTTHQVRMRQDIEQDWEHPEPNPDAPWFEFLDILCVLEWMEVRYPGIKDRVYDNYMCTYCDFANDTHFFMDMMYYTNCKEWLYTSDSEGMLKAQLDQQLHEDLQLIRKEFDLPEQALFYATW
jgi:hypothetical protein